MGNIKIEINQEKDLSTFTTSESFSVQDVCDALDRYYSGPITSLLLWDATRLNSSSWQRDDILTAVRKTKEYSHLRAGGKSALVMPRDLPFGLARMYQAYSEVHNLQIDVEVFRSIEKAVEWLGFS